MIATLFVPAWIALQEVGFDIVSMWNQMGYLVRGTLLLLALVPVVLVGLFVWWLAKPSKRSSSDGSRR